MGLTGAGAAPLSAILDGGGDIGRASPGLAGVAFRKPTSKAVFAQAAGLAHVGPDRPMTLTAPARIASISKLVAAIGFMTLVEAGAIGLDDDVCDHLDYRLRHPLFPDTPITPRRLLSHTSGLRNGPSYPVPFGRPLSAALTPGGRQWDDGAWFGPATEPPGVWFAYADVNYTVIAQLIERVSGLRFDHFMTRRVLAPLGLTCGYNWSGVPQAARDQAATLYRKAPSDEGPWDPAGPWIPQLDDTVPPAPIPSYTRAAEVPDRPLESYVLGENGFVFAPQGGLRASARDLEVLARLLVSGGSLNGARILKPETVALMSRPAWRRAPDASTGDGYGGVMRAYGLGVQTLTGEGEDDMFDGCNGWIGHLGEAYGLLSGLWVDPAGGRGFVYILTGQSRDIAVNKGRSGMTWQEERLAALLSRA